MNLFMLFSQDPRGQIFQFFYHKPLNSFENMHTIGFCKNLSKKDIFSIKKINRFELVLEKRPAMTLGIKEEFEQEGN
jgi:hypothetical protein